MIQPKFRLMFLAFLILGAIGVVLLSIQVQPTETPILGDQATTVNSPLAYPIKYFDPDLFWPSIQATGSGEISRFQAGVVPHHALAGTYIAEYFQQLSQQPPETLIVLGPNHANLPDNTILTSTQSWQSPFGLVDIDIDLVNHLTASGLVTLDSTVFENEQCIGTLVPYIRYYLSKTKLVPIIFTKPLPLARLEALASELQALTNDNTHVLASIDFSHYLVAEDANVKDAQTMTCITNFDYACLLAMDHENLDSAEALVTLLTYVKRKDNLTLYTLRHTNAAKLTGQISAPTTSYFVLGWREK